MTAVHDYILEQKGNQRAILSALDQFIMSYPAVTSRLRYGIPFYDRSTWVCYLNTIKGDGIELVFLQGKKLSNESGHLQDKGRKMVAGISIFDAEVIPYEAIDQALQESFLLLEE